MTPEPSPAKLVELVDVDRQLPPVDGDDQPQPDRHLAGRHHHHDQSKDLAVGAAPHAREGDQREIGGIEHQLEAEQDDQWVGPREHAGGADAEDQRRDDQVPADRHYQPASAGSELLVARSGVLPARSVSGSVPNPPRIPVLSAMVPVSSERAVIRRGSKSSSDPSRPRRRRARTTAPIAATIRSSDAISKGNR